MQVPQIANYLRAKGFNVPSWPYEWHSYPEEKKKKVFNEFMGFEINYFIKRHDPHFFSLIKEFIQNKIKKNFIDFYLLDDKACLEY